ncbi:MAG: DinB family protein [Phycisphaerales bacterium]
MTTTAQYLANTLKTTLDYADRVAADIPADQFAHKPHPTINHPAWLYGHLSTYPDKLLPMIGHEDLSKPNTRFVELFKAGTDCADDPSIYPSKDEIMAEFRSKHATILRVLPEVSDEILDRENPWEPTKQVFPKVGHAVQFIFANHIMMHLGQASAWRRCVGLGPA